MKTQVELYEVEDVRAETPEQCAEAMKLIEELGLEGQKQSTPIETTTRFPFRIMTDEEQFVYSQLCPSRQALKTYNNSPVPLEVLKVAAYARGLQDERISHLEVWSADSTRVKDPVLVGRKTAYSDPPYILARWGDELLPLTVLLPDAIKRWWDTRMDELNGFKVQIENELTKPMPKTAPKRTYLSLSL